jgi:sterol desaturase/sphingolipid hydroxylase (fatty acid hydroxylase superfamily)
MFDIAAQNSLGKVVARWSTLSAVIALSIFLSIKGLSLDNAYLSEYMIRGFSRALSAFQRDYEFASAYFWGPLFIVVLAERLMPANRFQKIISPGLICDLIWFISAPILLVFFISNFREYLGAVYNSHFDFLTIQSIRGLPLWAQVTIVVLASDFISWLSHWIRHKVKLFWHFHSIHHSQRELTYLSIIGSIP